MKRKDFAPQKNRKAHPQPRWTRRGYIVQCRPKRTGTPNIRDLRCYGPNNDSVLYMCWSALYSSALEWEPSQVCGNESQPWRERGWLQRARAQRTHARLKNARPQMVHGAPGRRAGNGFHAPCHLQVPPAVLPQDVRACRKVGIARRLSAQLNDRSCGPLPGRLRLQNYAYHPRL